MFSYRHAFHAGNHADVLKHVVLVGLLRHFTLKDTPFWVIDTHAGAGLYALDGEWAGKRSEFADGIGRLAGPAAARGDVPEAVADYLDVIAGFNRDGVLRVYPGSPFIALRHLRPRDRLRLFELHPTEIEVLRGNVAQAGREAARQTRVDAADGFTGLQALLPPPPRRGLVLIDPSYEDKRDYARTVEAVRGAQRRFATGCIAVWYPQVQRREVGEMARTLTRLPDTRWLHATLTVRRPSTDGLGLHGSGLFVVNPPWTLPAALQAALPWLAARLACDDGAGWTLDSAGL
jgi:23S rRNA (adenine2030-N6)-methyltransferase